MTIDDFTEDEIEMILECYYKGFSIEKIAKQLEVDTNRVILQIKKYLPKGKE